jgi:hypothetical protein
MPAHQTPGDADALTAVSGWEPVAMVVQRRRADHRPYALRRRMRPDMNQNDEGRPSEGETPRSQVSRLSESNRRPIHYE